MLVTVQLEGGESLCVDIEEMWRVEDLRNAVCEAGGYGDVCDFDLHVDGVLLARSSDAVFVCDAACGLAASSLLTTSPSSRTAARTYLAHHDPPITASITALSAATTRNSHTTVHHILHSGLLNLPPLLLLAVNLNCTFLYDAVRECLEEEVQTKPAVLLKAAVRHNDVVFLSRLLAECDGVWEEDGDAVLLCAARWGNLEACRVVLQCEGVCVNWKAAEGETALVAACEGGHLECARLLLDHGAQVNPTSRLFPACTPLFRAANGGHATLCKLLLEHGADVNCPDEDGNSPLTLASRKSENEFLECCRVLADHAYTKRWMGHET